MYTVVALAAYAAVALLVTTRALVVIARQPRSPKYQLDGVDRTLLVVVAVVTGLAWPVLLPFYARGLLRSGRGRAASSRLGGGVAVVRGWLWRPALRLRLRSKSAPQIS